MFQANGAIITGNIILDNTINSAHGIVLRYSSGVTVANNRVRNMDGHGVFMTPEVYDVAISENRIEDCAGDGIREIGTSDAIRGERIHCTENRITGCSTGINVRFINHLKVVGNTVLRSQAHGVLIQDVHGLMCDSNFAIDGSQAGPETANLDGIRIQNVTQGAVAGNLCRNSVPSSGQKWGLFLQDCNQISLNANKLAGNRLGGLAVQESGDIEGWATSSQPSAGTWSQGSFVKKYNIVEVGPVGSKVVIVGWLRLTTGSSHVPGIDWVTSQVLTGN